MRRRLRLHWRIYRTRLPPLKHETRLDYLILILSLPGLYLFLFSILLIVIVDTALLSYSFPPVSSSLFVCSLSLCPSSLFLSVLHILYSLLLVRQFKERRAFTPSVLILSLSHTHFLYLSPLSPSLSPSLSHTPNFLYFSPAAPTI